MKSHWRTESLNTVIPVPGMRNYLGNHVQNNLESRKKKCSGNHKVNQRLGVVELQGRTQRLKEHQKGHREYHSSSQNRSTGGSVPFWQRRQHGGGLLWAWLLLLLHPGNFSHLPPTSPHEFIRALSYLSVSKHLLSLFISSAGMVSEHKQLPFAGGYLWPRSKTKLLKIALKFGV